MHTNKPIRQEHQMTVDHAFLSPPHTGMRISASGVLGRIRDGQNSKGLNFVCGEMLRHLEQMATLFYSGDIQAVDEFLQLYGLDDERPTNTRTGP